MTEEITGIIKYALAEDIRTGDITSDAVIPHKLLGTGEFYLKQPGIAAGLEIAEEVFRLVDKKLIFTELVKEGERHAQGKIIARIEGSARSILTGERTALNFLQRMSGIATMANDFQKIINHTKAQIIDTRKTVPGLRVMDKLAVKLGGCSNHRIGLYDMFLIKDNHIEAAGSITIAVEKCKKYRSKINANYKIEVETTNLEQVQEALNNEVDIIMLDNFDIDEMKKAVNLISGRCKIEASGMVNIDTVQSIAETGVDFISVGALTHSVKALDISLEIKI